MLTVVCKTTFVLLPGESRVAPEQDPPNTSDEYLNGDERCSLRESSDLAPFKRHADVILVGHAYAPRAQPTSRLAARLIVGELDKALEVHADRTWTAYGELRQGAPFLRMPLVYERAAGGPTTWNPVGMSAHERPDAYGTVPVPNLLPPGFRVSRQGEDIPPIGLGPIAPRWPGRLAKLFWHAGTWDFSRWNERPLPEHIDAAYFNVAPEDQQVSELRGDERILLESLHAGHARLVTRLPGIVPRAVVQRTGIPAQQVRLRCDTLSIDTDRGLCHLVWRGQVALARADEPGLVTISQDVQDVEGTTTMTAAMPAMTPALPFREAALDSWTAAVMTSPAPRRPQRWEDDGTGTLPAVHAASLGALPFTGPVDQQAPPSGLPFIDVGDAPPFATAPVAAQVSELAELAPTPAREALASPGSGPRTSLALSTPAAATTPRAAGIEPAAPVAPAPKPEQALPLTAFPIERVASIAASIARRKSEKVAILKRNDLAAAHWASLERHWEEAMKNELSRGKTELLSAYDDAYVAQLEGERGIITVEEYARLLVAAERGTEREVLDAMGLPRGALLRLRRVWLKKTAADAGLAKRVREAIEEE
ncbi:hypothetical protein SOCE26_011210 [Sorangium cellulosum]|uniref:DUF2169 domain-containing protein n=2 Tax=Sorangium cellulosum TaxID=56 RepID=A0A2L0EK97_SORCE|nr:hypothetical protein SOCE26_011210 [Sorangium cellulosum]